MISISSKQLFCLHDNVIPQETLNCRRNATCTRTSLHREVGPIGKKCKHVSQQAYELSPRVQGPAICNANFRKEGFPYEQSTERSEQTSIRILITHKSCNISHIQTYIILDKFLQKKMASESKSLFIKVQTLTIPQERPFHPFSPVRSP